MRRLLMSLVLLLPASMAATAEEFGPPPGSVVPEHQLVEADGTPSTLNDVMGTNGATVLFSRSLDWCPICKAQAAEMREEADAFAAAGYPLVIVTTDDADALAGYGAKEEIDLADGTVTYLGDPSRALIVALGLQDPAFATRPEGHRFHGLPFPTTLVIDTDGVVLDTLYEADQYGDARGYVARITPEVTLAALAALEQAP